MRAGTRSAGLAIAGGLVARGEVLARLADGSVRVDVDAKEPVNCSLLETSEGPPLRLEPGDAVLIWRPEAASERAIVLGRLDREIGRPDASPSTPDELVIEAKKGLILRVGEGSITLRADGKILIKGKDLVSHAKRMNRIKGGAVSLN